MIAATSSYYLSNFLANTVSATQADLAARQIELSTGRSADPGSRLGALAGLDASLRNRKSLLLTLVDSNGLASSELDVSQQAMGRMRASAQSALEQLTLAATSQTATSLSDLGRANLDELTSKANTSFNGQYVFGGINSGQTPINDYNAAGSPAKAALVGAFTTQFGFPPTDPAAAGIPGARLNAFLTGAAANLFAAPAWSADWSAASSTSPRIHIAPGQTIDAATNANQSAFKDAAQAYAILAEFGGSPFNREATSAVASRASNLLGSSVSGFIGLEGALGAAKARAGDASSAMNAETAILTGQIDQYEKIDPYEVSTNINLLTTKLQTAYQLTAQLQQMSLVKHLPA